MVKTGAAAGAIALMLTWTAANAAEPPAYADLLTQLKAGKTDLDYQQLRYAFTRTAQYDPYGAKPERKQMIAAFNAKDCAKALPAAAKVLDANFTDIEGHIVSAECGKAQNDNAGYTYHRKIALGLLNSIARSGDGEKPETAYVVIAVAEEYIFLSTRGYRVTRQALLRAKPHEFDAMDVVDKSGATKTILFNIDIPATWLKNKLAKPPAPAPKS